MDWYKHSSTEWALIQFQGHFTLFKESFPSMKRLGENPENMVIGINSLRDMAHQLYERIDADIEQMEKKVFE